jgi:hypothetical protein
MVNTKIIVMLIALSVVVALIAGIAVSQLASAQANATRSGIGQTGQGSINGAYPQQGYYAYGSGHYANGYGYGGGMGMGMCGRFW